ncbi:MAG: hypothetical protein ACR2NB_15140 [Solirubrobacteraceae bacterium]
MRARTLILLTLGLLALLAAPAAQAATPGEIALAKIYKSYFQGKGRIDPCQFSAQQLKLAQSAIPADVRQYASDFPGAIQAAIEARARGECSGGKAAAPVGPPAGAGSSSAASPSPTPSPPPAATAVPMKTVVPDPPGPASTGASPVSGRPDVALERASAARPAGTAPMPLLALGALALLFAFASLLLVTGRRRSWAQGSLAPLHHSWREAAWRMGGTWETFRDWVRVGR